MSTDGGLIVQLLRDGAVDRNLRANLPSSIASGRIVLDHIADQTGRLGPPQAGTVVMSVLSPEALIREQQQVREVIRRAEAGDVPLVIIVEAAEELREDQLVVVLDAASRGHRHVILRVMADA
jgi:hypothetical protein